jgi:hypothetical protein
MTLSVKSWDSSQIVTQNTGGSPDITTTDNPISPDKGIGPFIYKDPGIIICLPEPFRWQIREKIRY